MGKKSGSYYAVALGRSTGVYTSWADAEAQVKGFAGARFKKFPTQVEAQAFVVSNGGGTAAATAPLSSATATGHKRGRADSGPPAETENSTGGSISPPENKRHASSGAFYAVLEGHSTGVVSCWKDVLNKTEGYDRPVYRKFETREAADAYAAGYAQAKAPRKKQFVESGELEQSPSAEENREGALGGTPVFWYAVAKGRKTGVFDNWAEAKIQIDGLFRVKYKKFPSKAEAETFVRDHQELTTPQTGDPDPKHPDSLVAFCDGSALQNGRFGCQAGYACIFPHNPSWNVAKKLVEARATNNRAEYLAALEGMKRANQEDPSRTKPLFIFSDSMLLIRSMTEWIVGWQKKNWVKADGNPVLNRDLLEMLLKEKGKRRIVWRHVKAHTGKKDWHSKWNDVADHAARNAAAGWEPTSNA